MRFRQEWHILWVQGNLADLETGTSSAAQVKQETIFSGIGGGAANQDPSNDDFLFVDTVDLALLVSLRATAGRCESGLWILETVVVLLRSTGLFTASVDVDLVVGSVFLRSARGTSCLFGLTSFSVVLFLRRSSLAALSCSFWKSRRSTPDLDL